MNLRVLFPFLDRRKDAQPVMQERRKNGRSRHQRASDDFKDALDDLEKTVRMRREDLLKKNPDSPGFTVVFSTYREICPNRGPTIMEVNYCRHPDHPDRHESSLTICEEKKCPRLAFAVKGIAA